MHPVVRFDGSSAGFNLAAPLDLKLQNVSVYVVASVDNSISSRIIVGIFSADPGCCYGWSMGLNDGSVGDVKWWTYTTAAGHNFLPNYHFQNHAPVMLAGALSADTENGTKILYTNGVYCGSVNNLGRIQYSPYSNEKLTVGYLGTGGQNLRSDIAEILVFSSVDEAQRTAVESYLNAKYFLTDPPAAGAPPTENMVLWLRAEAGVNTAPAPVPAYAWADQAPGAAHSGMWPA